jgi:hypothetical protein
MIHANSVEAFRGLNKAGRRAAILGVYRNSSVPLTDREVAERLGFTDMNMVRPRITDLIDDKQVAEIYNVPDPVINRTVRCCTNKAKL